MACVDNDPELPEQEAEHYYFHTDQIGTPQEMTNAEGQMVWRAYYKAWGGLEALSPNQVEQNLRFQGQYHDRESGLYYNTFRYYDPAVGRFTTQDPIGLMGGENLYRYAPNAPGWIDPIGWCSAKLGKNMGAAKGDGTGNHHLISEEVMKNFNGQVISTTACISSACSRARHPHHDWPVGRPARCPGGRCARAPTSR
ncbi:RHS repeat domain-containing protein [Pseudomonas sp. IPO3778]|uniref:RHS repeat domain-containing protein n=1 Tax=Pseudomonas sp. IPO3778 TaxID=2726976 RepID=UPI0035C2657C